LSHWNRPENKTSRRGRTPRQGDGLRRLTLQRAFWLCRDALRLVFRPVMLRTIVVSCHAPLLRRQLPDKLHRPLNRIESRAYQAILDQAATGPALMRRSHMLRVSPTEATCYPFLLARSGGPGSRSR
jgi:hypothetical protein